MAAVVAFLVGLRPDRGAVVELNLQGALRPSERSSLFSGQVRHRDDAATNEFLLCMLQPALLSHAPPMNLRTTIAVETVALVLDLECADSQPLLAGRSGAILNLGGLSSTDTPCTGTPSFARQHRNWPRHGRDSCRPVE